MTPAVVVIRLSETRPFDTESTNVSTATGFVVDAERGIILSNRHVVSPGPVVAEAVFLNQEEVDIQAVYRDPVHDFGFFRYDPAQVRFMERTQLELAPERARVGADIRVIGNDAGEKLSILAGTLARLDRDAPAYGRGRFNDFNTFYYQAASNTSGGSSGSPVVDRSGRVVALNAGGKRSAASSYYLPLDRVVRAFELVRDGKPVPRGTLQTVFLHKPYDEVRRLGLRTETEAAARRSRPDALGMLVVGEVVPEGPAEGKLQPGDVLVRIEGELVSSFRPLADALDDRVGREITLDVERGGEPIRVSLQVGDLHAITPRSYLEVGGSVLHALSYQQARNYGLPVQGVYLASAGYMFRRANVPSRALLREVGGEPTPTLEDVEAAFAALPDGAQVPVRYSRITVPKASEVAVVTVDRRWHPMRRCTRDDATGDWPCLDSPEAARAEPQEPASTRFRESADKRIRRVAPSLGLVRYNIPFRIDGVYGDSYLGAGLVVDAEQGLVVVDRDTVPASLGDATITFAGSVEVPAEVVSLHPEHNLALIRYDPARLGDTPVRDAELRPVDLEAGDEVWLVALTESQQLISEKTQVSRVEVSSLPTTSPPRYRETNAELIGVSRAPTTIGGVLVDSKGRILSHWASFSAQGRERPRAFFAGIPAELILDMVEPVRAGEPFAWRSIGAELRPLPLSKARSRGLSDAAARRLEEHDAARRRVLEIRYLAADVRAAEMLREGDLILAIDGEPVTRVREVERAVQQTEEIELTLLRDGGELLIRVPTDVLSDRGRERALLWAGALLQEPHRAVATQRGIPPGGIYVSWFAWGSPSHRYGLGATRRIVDVDNQPTPDLDAFLAAVAEKRDRDSVRLRTRDLEGKAGVITLKLDTRYWPTTELHRSPEGWSRTVH